MTETFTLRCGVTLSDNLVEVKDMVIDQGDSNLFAMIYKDSGPLSGSFHERDVHSVDGDIDAHAVGDEA